MKTEELIELINDKIGYDIGNLEVLINDEDKKIILKKKKQVRKPKVDKMEIVKEKLKSEDSIYSPSEFREAFKYYHQRALGTPYISKAPMDYKYLKQIFNLTNYTNNEILVLRKYFKMATTVYAKDQKTIVHLGWKLPEVLRALEVDMMEESLNKLGNEDLTGEVF